MKNAENWTYILIYVVSKYKSNYGGPEETRTLDLSDANRTLSRMVQIYAPKILRK